MSRRAETDVLENFDKAGVGVVWALTLSSGGEYEGAMVFRQVRFLPRLLPVGDRATKGKRNETGVV